jgi:hypothetical protein
MSVIKNLAKQRISKATKFMNSDVTIYKLSVADIMGIQESAKGGENMDDSEGFEVLRKIITAGVDGGDELTEEDFMSFPLEELSRLSNEIMKFSGIVGEKGK